MNAMLTMLLVTVLALSGCAELMSPPPTPAPCRETVGPIRDNHLIIVINYNFAYEARDPGGARADGRLEIMDKLDELGGPDGNRFAESNGQPVNFYFSYTIYNDGQDHFTGQVELSGWGWERIATIYSGQYPYASPLALVRDLTGKAYSWINTGWHDSNSSCRSSAR